MYYMYALYITAVRYTRGGSIERAPGIEPSKRRTVFMTTILPFHLAYSRYTIKQLVQFNDSPFTYSRQDVTLQIYTHYYHKQDADNNADMYLCTYSRHIWTHIFLLTNTTSWSITRSICHQMKKILVPICKVTQI